MRPTSIHCLVNTGQGSAQLNQQFGEGRLEGRNRASISCRSSDLNEQQAPRQHHLGVQGIAPTIKAVSGGSLWDQTIWDMHRDDKIRSAAQIHVRESLILCTVHNYTRSPGARKPRDLCAKPYSLQLVLSLTLPLIVTTCRTT